MKVYVAAAGDSHYPLSHLKDIRGVFKTPEEAKSHLARLLPLDLNDGGDYEWYVIIELDTEAMTWMPLDIPGGGL